MNNGSTRYIDMSNSLVTGKEDRAGNKGDKKTRLDLISGNNLLYEKAGKSVPLSEKTKEDIRRVFSSMTGLVPENCLEQLETKAKELEGIFRAVAAENPNFGKNGPEFSVNSGVETDGVRKWAVFNIAVEEYDPRMLNKKSITHCESMKFELEAADNKNGNGTGSPHVLLRSTIINDYMALRRYSEETERVLPEKDGPANRVIRAAETVLNYDSDLRWENRTQVPPMRAESLLFYCQQLIHETWRGYVPHIKFNFENIVNELNRLMPEKATGVIKMYQQDKEYPGILCLIGEKIDTQIYVDSAKKTVVVRENGVETILPPSTNGIYYGEIPASAMKLYYENANRAHDAIMKVAEAIVPPKSPASLP